MSQSLPGQPINNLQLFSLLQFLISLIDGEISLFSCIGNLLRKPPNHGQFQRLHGSQVSKIAKFPVKFPVSREIIMETGPI
jgi:hypothetical protein